MAIGTRILAALAGTWMLAIGVIRLGVGLRDSSRTEARVRPDQPWGSRLALVCWGLGGIALGIGFLAAAVLDTGTPGIVGAVLFTGLMVFSLSLWLLGWYQLRERRG